MRWHYCIHHAWPEERTPWAEAFVRPADAGETLWVVIDSIGDDAGERLREWLGDRPYRVAEDGEAGDADLVVNAPDFTKAEFLQWVEVWLRARGFAVTELVSAPLSEFAGTHPHADLLISLAPR